MKIKFWGVRGSIPTPLTQKQLRSRIAAAIARIRPADQESAETRELFLAELPPYIFGSVGGNTTCLSIHAEGTPLVIIDAGSGIRELAAMVNKQRRSTKEFHIFFTHFHWDHLQGLPFFSPAGYKKRSTMYFYSPKANLEEIVRGQMVPPYFPVDMDAMAAEKRFIRLKSPATRLGKLEIRWKNMRHPGGCIAYKMSHNGRSMIFATDTELSPEILLAIVILAKQRGLIPSAADVLRSLLTIGFRLDDQVIREVLPARWARRGMALENHLPRRSH